MAGDFAGFISYSRRASAGLAADLQAAVERFAKPWYRLRAVRIFRDDATMSANTALWPTIEAALASAEWLILLTSRAAAESPWVGNEVTWWLEHKSAQRIMIVLEEGDDLVWDPAADDFDWPHTANLTPVLRGAYAEEPRWIDLRWYELDDSLGRADPRWEERVADVAAAVRFAERDQLIGANVREHRRALRLLRAGIVGLSLLLVASLVATVFAVLQGREANRQADLARAQEREATRQATIALARQLAAQADALAPTDLRTASLLAVQAYRTHDDAQTRATLFQVATASPQLARSLPVGSQVTAAAATPDGVVVTGAADGTVTLWRGTEPTEIVDLGSSVTAVSVSDDANVVLGVTAATDDERAVAWVDGVATELTEARDPSAGAVSPAGDAVAVSGFDSTQLWAVDVGVATYVGGARVGGSLLAFGPRGLGVFSGSGTWAVLDSAARVSARGFHSYGINAISFALSGDASTLAVSMGRRDYSVWRGLATYADRDANALAASDLAESSGIALSADGARLATFADGELSVVKVRRPGSAPVRPSALAGSGDANTDVIAFGGSRVLVTGSGDEALVWDVDQLFRFGRQLPAEVSSGCTYCRPPVVQVSPDGGRVLVTVGSTPGTASVVDLTSGEQRVLDANGGHLEAATWLDDGRVLAFDSLADQIVVVDPAGGGPQVLATSGADDSSGVIGLVSDGAVDGRVSLIRESGLVETVDLSTRATVARSRALSALLDGGRPLLFGIAPDQGQAYVSVAGDVAGSQLAVVDLASDVATVSDLPQGVAGAAYDADSVLRVFDGQRVGVLGADGTLTDAQPAEVVEEPAVVTDGAATLAVSGGLDGTVHLIDLARQGAEFGSFSVPAEEDSFAISAFSRDGTTLVTAIQPMAGFGLGSSVRVLSLDPDDWAAAACTLAGRDLTADDWARYGVGDPPADLRCAR